MKEIEIVKAQREYIDDIVIVENLSFKIPWSRQSIIEELLENKMAIYFCALAGGQASGSHVAESGIAYDCDTEGKAEGKTEGKAEGKTEGNMENNAESNIDSKPGCKSGSKAKGKTGGKAIGYAGMWQVLDEGHITNIAVHPEFRNYGVGSALMEALLSTAKKLGIIALTLEVRRSNYAAQALYKKYGFADGGMRKAYYADNNEDAIIMWKRLEQD